MTRGVHPPAVPARRENHRFSPYTIPDIAQFRLQTRTRAELFSDGLDNLEPDGLNVEDWIDTAAVESPPHEPLTDVDDKNCPSSIRNGDCENAPTQADALDVVHAILDQAVDDQDLFDESPPNEPLANESILPDARNTTTEEPGAAWVPEDLPDDIFVESDTSSFRNRDEEKDEPNIFRNENLEEHQPANFTMTATEFKFALFLSEFKLSRRAWSALCEVIQTSPHEDLLALPKWKPTLMDKFNNQLPKCAMRRKTVKLDVAKLPNRASPTEDLVWLDMEHFISKLLISPLYRQHIYQGLGQLTRYVTEFWQTRAWGESIRTTSGNFVENKWGEEVVPSDFTPIVDGLRIVV
ncbi:hypothetical protein ONZ43_g2163 [Nemania bipapillata]|uniref:Uncharacterized protein n=1 Tax=Nemania bipapillata TaxID=110536 RepID=A0ACC2J1Q9_9PEZI|nr:hypothetical protein ONZ43_g2163 [Nemania bipapillata]